ncbi:putative bifunctional diguanylate cyclase/phosphodiesterase [Pseudoroseicyclus sp. H15]
MSITLLRLQNEVLEMIATGESLERTTDQLCREVERLAPGVLCSMLSVDPEGRLHPLAGPSLDPDYAVMFEGLQIGPEVGSCGTAAYTRQEVAVTDIETDYRWKDYKHLALPLGLRACWSSPILDASGNAIATFAFYYGEPRGPTELEREIVRQSVHLCVIALEREMRDIEASRRAFVDALTGLPNRAAFDAALADLDCDTPGAWGLLAIDVDNLKVVNDTFGHHIGDCMLVKVGQLIAEHTGADQTYRIGGDEFAVLLKSQDALDDLDGLAERLVTVLSAPANCGSHVLSPNATIGAAILSEDDNSPSRVRQNADLALYHAKDTHRGGFVLYWPGIGTNITRRLKVIQDVDAALSEGRIEAHYQPIVRLDSREIVGLEALCRMRVGDEIVSAAAFHEATTDVHVATALTERMMSLVAADVRHWLDMGIAFQHVGINVSSADMQGHVDKVLEAAFSAENVPLQHVILEVTESVYIGHGDRGVQSAIRNLRAKGLRVALDDFGTGFASLTHLLTVPVDIIKIDKSFVDHLVPADSGAAIIEGLLSIAAKLGMRVVAEGIETEEQARRLLAIGGVLGQGYLFSRAVDRDAMTAMLLDRAQKAG